MGIKDKIKAVNQSATISLLNRVYAKVDQLDSIVSKQIQPGFKQIEAELNDLGVVPNNALTVSQGYFIFELSRSSIALQLALYGIGTSSDVSAVLIDGITISADFISIPNFHGSLSIPDPRKYGLDYSDVVITESNIESFERFMDDAINYINKNSSLIIDTVEDAVLAILKSQSLI